MKSKQGSLAFGSRLLRLGTFLICLVIYCDGENIPLFISKSEKFWYVNLCDLNPYIMLIIPGFILLSDVSCK